MTKFKGKSFGQIQFEFKIKINEDNLMSLRVSFDRICVYVCVLLEE